MAVPSRASYSICYPCIDCIISLKPIFHCDAKPFGLGPGVGLDPQRHNFCVRYTNMLVSKNAKICITPSAKLKIYVTPNAKTQREPMEYRLRWVPNAKFSHWPCTFLFCVCRFHSRWVPFFSGIWALLLLLRFRYMWMNCFNHILVAPAL